MFVCASNGICLGLHVLKYVFMCVSVFRVVQKTNIFNQVYFWGPPGGSTLIKVDFQKLLNPITQSRENDQHLVKNKSFSDSSKIVVSGTRFGYFLCTAESRKLEEPGNRVPRKIQRKSRKFLNSKCKII